MAKKYHDLQGKFGKYRQLFDTFLAKEFINLPVRDQEKVIYIIEKFVYNTKRIHEEAKGIKEKIVHIDIKKIIESEKNNIIEGSVVETGDLIRMDFPDTVKLRENTLIEITVYSNDGKTWYSSKKQLITGR